MSATTDATMWAAEVTVIPRPGVNDPAGDSIRGALTQLGYEAVASVRAGKVINLTFAADSEDDAVAAVRRMCEQLLANPVIETYAARVVPAGPSES